jgi:hypothetical protein
LTTTSSTYASTVFPIWSFKHVWIMRWYVMTVWKLVSRCGSSKWRGWCSKRRSTSLS